MSTAHWLRGGFGAIRGGDLLFWRSEGDLEKGLPAYARLRLGTPKPPQPASSLSASSSAAAAASSSSSATAAAAASAVSTSASFNLCGLMEPSALDRKLGAQLVVFNIAAKERWAIAFADDDERALFEAAVQAVVDAP